MADTRGPDYRDPRGPDYRDPTGPDYRDPERRMPAARSSNAMIGWAAGAVFIVLVLLFVFGVGRDTNRTADNPPGATTGQSANQPASRPATPPATTGQGTR
jgi:hypothetical protein